MNKTQAAAALELADKATPPRWLWEGECVGGREIEEIDAAFIDSARTGYPAALEMLGRAMAALQHRRKLFIVVTPDEEALLAEWEADA